MALMPATPDWLPPVRGVFKVLWKLADLSEARAEEFAPGGYSSDSFQSLRFCGARNTLQPLSAMGL